MNNRREFIRNVATGAAGVVLAGPALGFSAKSYRNIIGANDRIRMSMIGVNSRGNSMSGTFVRQKNTEISSVCDVDSRAIGKALRTVEQAGQQSVPKSEKDCRRVLEDKSLDAIYIATPDHWHAPLTIMGCQAGKHVYVEKPLSHNPREGEIAIAAARKYNKVVQMGAQRRSAPVLTQGIEQLRNGVIGRVYLAKTWYTNSRKSNFLKPGNVPDWLDYDLWQGPAPRLPYKDGLIHYNWHWFWHWGNGELGNNGVHTLDLCRWGLGVDFPTRVTSSGGRYRWEDDQETPDTHTVCLEFEDRRQITWEGLSCHRHDAKFVTFYGEAGALELESNGTHTVYDTKDAEVGKFGTPSVGDDEHVVNLLDAIRNDQPLALNAEIAEGHKSTLLCHLGNIAHRTGRTLNCDAANGHILGDEEAAGLWRRQYEPGWEPVV